MTVAQTTPRPVAAGSAVPEISARGRIKTGTSLFLAAPLLLLLCGVFFWPIGKFLATSFFSPDFTLEHYREVFENSIYYSVIFRTVWISVATALASLLLGYPVAYLMTLVKGRMGALVAACVFIPLWTSVLVRSYAWIVLLQNNGIINNWLKEHGLISTPIKMLYTNGAVLIAMIHVLLPFMILPLYSSLKSISPDLSKAALNLGASPLRAFLTVTLPLTLPGIFAGSIIVFVLALGFYITPALIGGPQTLMIATLVSQQATELLNWPLASAVSTVLLVLSLGTVFIFKRSLKLEKVFASE